ncbi:hypothetical protein GmHk_15G042592 [Glycine max]|nr:hypothetical protein GmHk_15G042592 [Glycine max]
MIFFTGQFIRGSAFSLSNSVSLCIGGEEFAIDLLSFVFMFMLCDANDGCTFGGRQHGYWTTLQSSDDSYFSCVVNCSSNYEVTGQFKWKRSKQESRKLKVIPNRAVYFLFSRKFENSRKITMFKRDDPFTGSFINATSLMMSGYCIMQFWFF